MAQSVTITWRLSATEHRFWLAQARSLNQSVGEFLYLLACFQIAEWKAGRNVPGGYAALGEAVARLRTSAEQRANRR